VTVKKEIPIAKLKNLGPKSFMWLEEIGIYNKLDLEKLK
jgi:hypothetical protein